MFVIRGSSANAPASVFGAGVVDILDAFSTTKNKTVRAFSGNYTAANNLGDRQIVHLASGVYLSTTAINSLTLYAANNLVAGSRFSLYGIRGS
jgi:hypothetical protein